MEQNFDNDDELLRPERQTIAKEIKMNKQPSLKPRSNFMQPTASRLLKEVKDEVVEMYKHQKQRKTRVATSLDRGVKRAYISSAVYSSIRSNYHNSSIVKKTRKNKSPQPRAPPKAIEQEQIDIEFTKTTNIPENPEVRNIYIEKKRVIDASNVVTKMNTGVGSSLKDSEALEDEFNKIRAEVEAMKFNK